MSFQYLVDQDDKAKQDLELKIQNGHARQMGHIENYFAIFQRLRIYKTFSVVCKFNKKINNPTLLFHALRPILLKYPILTATIVEQSVDDSVIPRPPDFIKALNEVKLKDLFIELDESLKQLKDEDLYNALNSTVIPYGQGNLTWKLAILDEYTLVYFANHTLADGIAGKYLFQDLEEQFATLDIPSLPNNIFYDSVIFNYEQDVNNLGAFPEEAEKIVNYKPPLWFMPEFFLNTFVINKLCPNTLTVMDDEINYKKIHIPAQQLSKIKKDLRDNEKDKKITLTPYIQVAWLNAQHKTNIYPLQKFVTNFLLAVDTRQYYPESTQDTYKYGLNTSATNKFFYTIKEFTWSWVDYINNYIKWCVKTKRPLYLIGFLTLEKVWKTRNMDAAVKKTQEDRTRTNTLFSNIGLVNSSENENGILIEDCVFTQHFNGSFYDVSMNAVATKLGGLNIVITSPKSAPYSKEKFEECCEVFEENLLSECAK